MCRRFGTLLRSVVSIKAVFCAGDLLGLIKATTETHSLDWPLPKSYIMIDAPLPGYHQIEIPCHFHHLVNDSGSLPVDLRYSYDDLRRKGFG